MNKTCPRHSSYWRKVTFLQLTLFSTYVELSDVTMEEVTQFQDRLLVWAESNLRDFPWRETTDPYEVLVAEILLGATLASKVVPIYDKFLNRYPNLAELTRADKGSLASLLEPLGLHNRRAAAFISIGEQLKGGRVPDSEDELLELPYVGRYAANATLCFAFGQKRAIVDDNVARVYGRSFGVNLNPQSDVAWEFAEQLLPSGKFRMYNLGLLDFGALVCKSGTPRCDSCFYTSNCQYFQQSTRDT